ncbi:hypothetical protein HpNP104_11990 [Helicobacter pylori]
MNTIQEKDYHASYPIRSDQNYPLMVVSMNYIGSKYKLIPFIQENIHAVVGQPLKWLLGSTLKNLFSLDSVLKANQVIPKDA